MRRILTRAGAVVLGIVLIVVGAPRLLAGGQALMSADAKTWIGDWALTIEGGRGPQMRDLALKDMSGKVAATLGGGRGGPIDITDITKKGNDVVLKFKQTGRGGEVEVLMTLMMQTDGTLKLTQQLNGNTQNGTGKKK